MEKRWFEQNSWNEEIESFFFKKLSRARKWNASQYLRIQSILLLKEENTDYQEVAFRLMQILFSEYPDAYIDVCFCHDALAEYYYNKGDYYQSYEHYEKIREYNLIHPQAKCCYVTSELGLVKNTIQLNDSSKYEYAIELINEIAPYFEKRFGFMEGIRKEFNYLCEQINKKVNDRGAKKKNEMELNTAKIYG